MYETTGTLDTAQVNAFVPGMSVVFNATGRLKANKPTARTATGGHAW
jgi:hypothetical protein